MRCKFKGDPILHVYVEEHSGGRCGDCSNLHVKYACWLGSSYPVVISGNSFAELFEAAAVCSMRLPQADRAGEESLMAYRIRAHELATVTEARRELAAEARKLAGLLESQEPDYSALHDAWEVLLDLAEEAERLRVQFFDRHPEQEAWLIEKRPWLDPKLELIGNPSRSPQSRASRPKRKQKATHSSM
jgi:hypothetical protein